MDPTDDGSTTSKPEPVEIDAAELSPDALRGLVESFVLREGTDYGEREASHESKIADVLRQLECGEARIVFDPETESATLVPRDELPGAG